MTALQRAPWIIFTSLCFICIGLVFGKSQLESKLLALAPYRTRLAVAMGTPNFFENKQVSSDCDMPEVTVENFNQWSDLLQSDVQVLQASAINLGVISKINDWGCVGLLKSGLGEDVDWAHLIKLRSAWLNACKLLIEQKPQIVHSIDTTRLPWTFQCTVLPGFLRDYCDTLMQSAYTYQSPYLKLEPAIPWNFKASPSFDRLLTLHLSPGGHR